MARTKEKTIWKILTPENAENITLEEVKNALWGENPDRVNFADFCGKGTPLCYAVCTGRMDIVRYFVEELKVDIVKPQNNTPLQVALSKGNMEMVEYFFEIDPLIGGSDYQANCIRATIRGRQLEMLKFLVETKHFFIGNEKNDEPLRSSVCCGWEFFKYLIDHGAVPTDRVVKEAANHSAAGTTDYTEKDAVHFRILKYLLEQTGIKYNLYEAVRNAIYKKNLECVKYLFSKGASVKTTEDKYGHRTPLLFTAVANNDFEMVKFLVSQGADIREKNDKGETLLEYIWWSKEKLPILKYIVEELHYFDETNKDYCLCGSNSLAVLKYLTKQGITYRQTIHSEKFSWLFQEMVRYGDLPLVKYLVEVLNFPIDMSSKGMGILCAMETTWNERNCKSFLYLIEKGAPVTVETGSIVSNPSMLDVAIGHVEDKNALLEDKKNIIKALLRKGIQCRENIANLSRAMFLCECIAEIQNELSSTQSPQISIEILQALLKGKDKKVIKNLDILFSKGFQIPQEIGGKSTLGIIAEKDDEEILKYFIEKRTFNINYCDSYRRTPLIYTLRKEFGYAEKCFLYLLAKGADTNYEDEDGISALQYACKTFLFDTDKEKLVRFKALIRHGADCQKFVKKGNRLIIQALKEIEHEKSVQEK